MMFYDSWIEEQKEICKESDRRDNWYRSEDPSCSEYWEKYGGKPKEENLDDVLDELLSLIHI